MHVCIPVGMSVYSILPFVRQARNDPSVEFHRLTEIFLGKSNTGNIPIAWHR